jgi:hypothetical protein
VPERLAHQLAVCCAEVLRAAPGGAPPTMALAPLQEHEAEEGGRCCSAHAHSAQGRDARASGPSGLGYPAEAAMDASDTPERGFLQRRHDRTVHKILFIVLLSALSALTPGSVDAIVCGPATRSGEDCNVKIQAEAQGMLQIHINWTSAVLYPSYDIMVFDPRDALFSMDKPFPYDSFVPFKKVILGASTDFQPNSHTLKAIHAQFFFLTTSSHRADRSASFALHRLTGQP